MDQKIAVTFIGILSGLIGGTVTAFVSHNYGLEASRQELLQTARRAAYVDWLSAKQLGVRANQLQEDNPSKAKLLDEEYALKGWQSLARIGVYGDRKVVEAVATWLRAFEQSKSCSHTQWKQDIAMYQSMRASLIPEDEAISDNDLSTVLLQCSKPTDN